MNRTIAKILTPIIGGNGRCRKCAISYTLIKPHAIIYKTRKGTDSCLALCDYCWNQLGTPEARLPYFRARITELQETVPEAFWPLNRKWQIVRKAVMEGK